MSQRTNITTQILLNLMSNAIKYNCEDGKATISSMPGVFDDVSPAERVRFP